MSSSDSNKIQDGSTTTKSFDVHSSMDTLVDKYDGFILDQFGVLHNGVHGLEGAPECVKELRKRGKKLVILSNSSSSSSACKAKLPSLGFDPTQLVGAVTSGQEAGEYIAKHYQNKKAVFLTWKTPKTPSPLKFLELCGPNNNISITDNPDEADLVILHGVDVLRGPGADGEATETSLDDFMHTGSFDTIDPILQQCAQRSLPMICCNPDYIMVKPDGSIGHMPGKIAQRYEQQYGGSVRSFGKPHKEHFQACLEKLQLPPDRVAHVGDSLHHDVAGANATGIASIFVAGGIHCQELGAPIGSLPSKEALQALFDEHGQTPTHVLPLFRF